MVLGGASGRAINIEYEEKDLSENLMKWLRSHNITIASSCDGEGVCKKCTIQNDWLTCQLSLGKFLERQPDGVVKVSYL